MAPSSDFQTVRQSHRTMLAQGSGYGLRKKPPRWRLCKTSPFLSERFVISCEASSLPFRRIREADSAGRIWSLPNVRFFLRFGPLIQCANDVLLNRLVTLSSLVRPKKVNECPGDAPQAFCTRLTQHIFLFPRRAAVPGERSGAHGDGRLSVPLRQWLGVSRPLPPCFPPASAVLVRDFKEDP